MVCCYLGWVYGKHSMTSENIFRFSGYNLLNSCTAKSLPFIYSRLFFQPLVSHVPCSGRRSLHQFDNPEEETLPLIYNYTPVYAANFTGYEQVYFFWMSHRYISPQRCSLPPTVLRIKDHFHHAAEKCFANTCHVWNKCAHLCKYSDIFLIFLGMNAFKFPTDNPLLWQC